MSSLLSGGIHVSLGGKVIRDEFKDDHSDMLTAFFKDAIRQIWILGFAIVGRVKDPTGRFGAIPAVVDAAAVDIHYYKPPMGIPKVRVYEKDTMAGLDSMFAPMRGAMRTPDTSMKNIRILSNGRWPSRDGRIRSVVSMICDEVELATSLTGIIREEALWLRSPSFVTEKKKQELAATDVLRRMDQVSKEVTALDAKRHMSSIELEALGANGMSSGGMQSVAVAVDDHDSVPVIISADDTKLHQVRTQAHIGDMVSVRDSSRDRIFQILGIPMSMFGGRSGGSSRSSADAENQRFVFTSLQQQFKPFIIRGTKTIFRWLGSGKSIKIEVFVPSVPPPSVIRDLYDIGLFKHTAFAEYLSNRHSIPMESLHTKKQHLPLHMQTGTGSSSKPKPTAIGKKRPAPAPDKPVAKKPKKTAL